MLADYLKDECRQNVMDGVQIYKLSEDRFAPGRYMLESGKTCISRLELFFCSGGFLELERKYHPSMRITKQEIFLAADVSDMKAAVLSKNLIGCCVSIDLDAAKTAFEVIFRTLGHPEFCSGRIRALLQEHGGCICVHNSCWNEAVFAVLRGLPYPEQGRYCAFKIAELLYLLCARNTLLNEMNGSVQTFGYSARTIRSVRSYMESHMDEKLTIASLSRQFHLSPTALKNGFHALYGQPVHAWLQCRRIRQAADLLQFSDLNILQIAQSVGYEGLSQFNLIFKRQYGVTPSHYRKMSETVII